MLANTAPAPSEQIADNLARFAFGMPFPGPPPRPADLAISGDEVKRLAGDYRVTWPDGSKRSARVLANGEQLRLQLEGQPAVRLMKQPEPDTFAAAGQPGRIRFDVANGAATGFVIDRRARPLEVVRAP